MYSPHRFLCAVALSNAYLYRTTALLFYIQWRRIALLISNNLYQRTAKKHSVLKKYCPLANYFYHNSTDDYRLCASPSAVTKIPFNLLNERINFYKTANRILSQTCRRIAKATVRNYRQGKFSTTASGCKYSPVTYQERQKQIVCTPAKECTQFVYNKQRCSYLLILNERRALPSFIMVTT